MASFWFVQKERLRLRRERPRGARGGFLGALKKHKPHKGDMFGNEIVWKSNRLAGLTRKSNQIEAQTVEILHKSIKLTEN